MIRYFPHPQVLFGDRSPTGRLPVTFPESEAQVREAMMPAAAWPGFVDGDASRPLPVPCTGSFPPGPFASCPKGGVVHYVEKLLVGHRWFDANNVQPAYCFGHGLGYTSHGPLSH
jgi:beta-glucosidase